MTFSFRNQIWIAYIHGTQTEIYKSKFSWLKLKISDKRNGEILAYHKCTKKYYNHKLMFCWMQNRRKNVDFFDKQKFFSHAYATQTGSNYLKFGLVLNGNLK